MHREMKDVKVALIQATPILYDKRRAAEKVVRLIHEAAAAGAKLILFPESFIPGYPQDLDLVTTRYQTPQDAMERFGVFYENAVFEGCDEFEQIAEAAKETGTWISLGVTEREEEKLFCSVFFFDPDGHIAGKHRKLYPTGFENMVWAKGEGNQITVVQTPFGRIGTAVCWENYMPLLRVALYTKGVSLYITPAADASDHWQCTIQHIALEGRCFVLSCNHFIPGNTEDLAPGRPKYSGGSAIVSPSGDYLAGPVYGEERILYATLHLPDCDVKRYDFDVNAPYGDEMIPFK